MKVSEHFRSTARKLKAAENQLLIVIKIKYDIKLSKIKDYNLHNFKINNA